MGSQQFLRTSRQIIDKHCVIQESLRSSGSGVARDLIMQNCKISGQKLEGDEPQNKHDVDLW